jgi:hypothetical protein
MYFLLFYVFLCCSVYCLFCVVLWIICVYMCTVLLTPGGYPIAVKYIISNHNNFCHAVSERNHLHKNWKILHDGRLKSSSFSDRSKQEISKQPQLLGPYVEPYAPPPQPSGDPITEANNYHTKATTVCTVNITNTTKLRMSTRINRKNVKRILCFVDRL